MSLRMKIYSVYDSKAGGFLPPFYCPNNAVAIRSFETAANQEGGDFNRWAGDYTLFCIGEFDSETGIIKSNTHHESLGLAVEYIKREPTAPFNLHEVKTKQVAE